MSVTVLLEQWLKFSEDVEPNCAAGDSWLSDLRNQTELYLKTCDDGKKV